MSCLRELKVVEIIKLNKYLCNIIDQYNDNMIEIEKVSFRSLNSIKFIPDKYIYNKYDPKILQKILNRQEQLALYKSKHKNYFK